jgi:hypothetical protein
VKYLGIDWATKHHVVALVGDDDDVDFSDGSFAR